MTTRIAIIGGGFTGAAIAFHLTRLVPPLDATVTVIEPRSQLGGGLAYSSSEPAHRINVPAARMSLLADRRSDFVDWLRDKAVPLDPAAERPDGALFPERRVFGAYVASRLAPALAAGRIVHLETRARSLERRHGSWCIGTDPGQAPIEADTVVIATTHPAPEPPRVLAEALAGHPKFIPDPWADDAIEPIAPDDRILIVGTGLSMADVVAALDRRNHRGPILAVSRRGLASRGHPDGEIPRAGEFLAPPATTTSGLLRRVRAAIATAVDAGASWHGVLDTLRDQGPGIWRALPLDEQIRLVRHLRPWWDTHRFRIAPQLEDVLARRARDGSFAIAAARILDARIADGAIEVTLRPRGGAPETRRFDAVVATTGPAHDAVIARQPFLAGLAEAGLIEPDPVGLGLHADAQGRAIVGDRVIPALYVAGPLARATFGELMGLPEVAAYAEFVAERIAEQPGEPVLP